ncbi:multicopper oxidase family protein [Candidatus Micrarchaeota archaeon]|nr:multicopper oxidase family protein [Candidatus Micrarchaeota archaeon]
MDPRIFYAIGIFVAFIAIFSVGAYFLFGDQISALLSGNVGILTPKELINRNTTGLSLISSGLEEVNLSDGESYSLTASSVAKIIDGRRVRMYSYNNQIPGPVLRVKQNSTIYVNFTNNLDVDSTMHWHGIRLENKYDGVPDLTQPTVKPGKSFVYKVNFPDEGMYWYHPHVQEDQQQDLGLYGVIMVDPANSSYYNPVNYEQILVLDDVLLKDRDFYPFYKNTTNFAMMGRFGNTMLINGKREFNMAVKKSEIVRFFVLNAANTRTFNLSINGVPLKMVGSDGGKYESEFFANSTILGPSERYIFEAQFTEPGEYEIVNTNPISKYVLGKISVHGQEGIPAQSNFTTLKSNPEIIAKIDSYRQYFAGPDDFTYTLTAFAKPMQTPGVKMESMESGKSGSSMRTITTGPTGIEWEDPEPDVNAMSTNSFFSWIIRDKATGKQNMQIKQQVKKNQVIKIKIESEKNPFDTMQHPIHIHGAQFLVLKTNGVQNNNLVWKDTVLVPAGGSVEILTYFPNEGEWMMHCHIAEHLSSGMMTSFVVK